MCQAKTKSFTSLAYKQALAQYATGVAVATTLGAQQQPVGMTINSFCSISLQPALVSWCIDVNAHSYPAFAKADHFALSVLSEKQQALAVRFAQRGVDKFKDIPLLEGKAPIIPNACAWFYCRAMHRLILGDHLMLVGEVVDFEQRPQAPLVFAQSQFNQLHKPLQPQLHTA